MNQAQVRERFESTLRAENMTRQGRDMLRAITYGNIPLLHFKRRDPFERPYIYGIMPQRGVRGGLPGQTGTRKLRQRIAGVDEDGNWVLREEDIPEEESHLRGPPIFIAGWGNYDREKLKDLVAKMRADFEEDELDLLGPYEDDVKNMTNRVKEAADQYVRQKKGIKTFNMGVS